MFTQFVPEMKVAVALAREPTGAVAPERHLHDAIHADFDPGANAVTCATPPELTQELCGDIDQVNNLLDVATVRYMA